MHLESIRLIVQWIGGLLAFVALGFVLYGVWRGTQRQAGIAFLGREISLTEHTQSFRLYLGWPLPDGFDYAPVGPDRDLCSAGYVQDFNWHPEGQAAVLSCDRGL
jgi:hypothetical protein